MAISIDLVLAISNTIVSLGGLAGVIVWASYPDNFRNILDDGYGLYWFTSVVSTLWGFASLFIYLVPFGKLSFPTLADDDKILTYAAVFFTGIWIAATAKVSNYLKYCIRELIDSNDDHFLCNGEIITTTCGGAAVILWVFTLVHYFLRTYGVDKKIDQPDQEEQVEMNADSSEAP